MNSRAFCLSDYASKLLFNSYNYGRDVAVAIICDITNLPEEEVNKNLEVVHPNVSINKKTVKSETDLVYKNDTRIFNIEINLKSGKGVEVKNDIYTYQLALHDVTSSKKYKNLKQTIQINIDNYDYLGENEFIYHAKMLDVKFHNYYICSYVMMKIN